MSPWIAVLLIVVFVLLLVSCLLIFVSVHVVVSYTDSFEYSVLIGAFRLPLGEKKKKPKKKSDLRKQKAKKSRQEQSVSDIQRFINITKSAVPILKEFREKLIVSNLSLHIYFGAEDTAQSAIAYGRAWALLGTITPILEQFLDIRKKDVYPVYTPLEDKMRLEFQSEISMKLGVLLLLLLRYFPKLNLI